MGQPTLEVNKTALIALIFFNALKILNKSPQLTRLF